MRLRILSMAVLMGWAGLAMGQGAYQEPLRPQVHFSPKEHWMNDPNGLVYFEGEYHLFYQYNGRSMVAEHVGWGHAVSKDLLHWEELGVAIPEVNGEAAFTGSAVVDAKNTSGLCEGGKACLVAIYTGNVGDGPTQREWQNIASSQDRGRTWKTYVGNPVLDLHTKEFRDPGVSWNEQAKAWVMAVSMPNEHQVVFYQLAGFEEVDGGESVWAGGADDGAVGVSGSVEGAGGGWGCLGAEGGHQSGVVAGWVGGAVLSWEL